MAAPIGNKFWELRSKHGRNKLFENPEQIWELACEYFQWCDDHPWFKRELIRGGDLAGQIVSIPTERPYTLGGLCIYLGINNQTWTNYRDKDDFLGVITHIEEIIRTQKFEGAAVGTFNANIIARDLGLSDKQELNHMQPIPVIWHEEKSYETKE